MTSRLEKLITLYPSAPWDWNALSANPCISFQFMLEHPAFPWNPKYVSRNTNVYEMDIREHLDYQWDYESLCMNSNLSMQFFNEFIIKPDEVRQIDWHHLSSNSCISISDIKQHPQYNWDDRYLSANPNITSNFILNEGRDRKWFVPFVCANTGINERDILKSTMKELFDWDYKNLSANPNLPTVFVKDNLDNDWNFHTISSNASLTNIELYHQIPWDDHGKSMNRNLSFAYVYKFRKVNWHLPSIMANSSIILNTIDLDWVRSRWNDSKPLEYYLSSNSSITAKWIERNQRNLCWKRLSTNQLN